MEEQDVASAVNGREIILETLLSITRDGQYSHIALKNVLDTYQYLDKKERAFITRVVDGTLERMIELDYIINKQSKTWRRFLKTPRRLEWNVKASAKKPIRKTN